MSSPLPDGAEPPGPIDESQKPSQPNSSAARVLRLIALAGTSAVVLWHVVALRHMESRQEWGFAVLVLAGLAVALTLRLVLPAESRRLLRHKDILIPLGLYIPASALLPALAAIPALAALLNPAWTLKILSISLGLSVAFLIQMMLAVILAGWTTTLVLQAVREDAVEPMRALRDIGRWLLPVLGTEFIGWTVLFAGVAVAIALATASIGLALILIAVVSLVWNLATAALLPVVVAERGPFLAALREGIQVSWARMRHWWWPVVLQMILLGWVTFIHVSFSSSPGPGMFTTQTKTNWQVNGFWTGGFEDTFRWHGELMKALEVEPLPLITTLLELMFAVLAIAIKLRIVTGMYAPLPLEREKLDELGLGQESNMPTAGEADRGAQPHGE
jgi:hypothetical protein